jgi:subtilisin family serine protease
MNRNSRAVARIVSALVFLGLAQGALAASPSEAEYQANEVIVKYKSGVVRVRESMNLMYNAVGVSKVRRLKGVQGLMKGYEQLFIREDVKLQDALAELRRNPMVEYAQPNYILRALPIQKVAQKAAKKPLEGGIPCIPGFDIPGCDPNATLPCLIPGIPFPPGCSDDGGGTPPPPGGGEPGNPPADRPAVQDPPAEVVPPVADPDLAKAYGIEKVGAPQVWETHKGSKDFVVAVIDTGIDYNHEDLSFNVWRNPTPGAKNDVVGYDFVHDDGLPFDDNQHGTHCAGTVGAVGGNGKGVSGVAQRVSIMGLKFLSGEGSGTTADAIRAIDYAIEHGARVLSNSWGGKGDDGNQALKDAIDRAKAKDVLFIAAAGNDGTDNDRPNPSYPAAFDNDNLISVAATDKSDALAFFSNYGKRTTHLAAPGVNVYSLSPGNRYAQLSGTSMACPHVAGAAALLWSKNPSWTYKQVKAALLNSVDPLPALANKTVTGGRLNILKALRSME